MKIKTVTINPMLRPMPEEVSFVCHEFIGLTEEEACDLFQRKDRAYLRS